MLIPINKHGRNTANLQLLDENFEKEQLLLFFPAGLVSRKQKGVIKDLEWKHTFINRAVKHKRNVIPAYVEGRNSNFFYNFANLRKKLGIKANIEMLYLPNEMFKIIGSTIKVKIGKEIPYSTFDKSKSAKQWAAYVKDKTYELK
jgi:putative hemolysin